MIKNFKMEIRIEFAKRESISIPMRPAHLRRSGDAIANQLDFEHDINNIIPMPPPSLSLLFVPRSQSPLGRRCKLG
jgi:hypothetical protein